MTRAARRERENVWDYPRPPRLEPEPRRARVELGGVLVADSRRALRVLETSHPPTIYVPLADVLGSAFLPAGGRSFCEFKGLASYFDIEAGGKSATAAAWYYPDPSVPFEALRDHVSVYPSRVDRCLLGEEVVRCQEGDFYGGWITNEIAGPFKGGAGTRNW